MNCVDRVEVVMDEGMGIDERLAAHLNSVVEPELDAETIRNPWKTADAAESSDSLPVVGSSIESEMFNMIAKAQLLRGRSRLVDYDMLAALLPHLPPEEIVVLDRQVKHCGLLAEDHLFLQVLAAGRAHAALSQTSMSVASLLEEAIRKVSEQSVRPLLAEWEGLLRSGIGTEFGSVRDLVAALGERVASVGGNVSEIRSDLAASGEDAASKLRLAGAEVAKSMTQEMAAAVAKVKEETERAAADIRANARVTADSSAERLAQAVDKSADRLGVASDDSVDKFLRHGVAMSEEWNRGMKETGDQIAAEIAKKIDDSVQKRLSDAEQRTIRVVESLMGSTATVVQSVSVKTQVLLVGSGVAATLLVALVFKFMTS